MSSKNNKRNRSQGWSGDTAPKQKKMCQAVLGFGSSKADSKLWKISDSLAIYTPENMRNSEKILGLDMDNTIIATASGRVFAKDENDWKIMSRNVRTVLFNYQEKGFKLAILSNQSSFKKDRSKLPAFQLKVERIIAELGVPIQAFFSLQSDINRKPRTGLWEAVERENGGVQVIKSESIFCGDAAGRESVGSVKKDFSCSDRLFAANVGVKFVTPEELWDGATSIRPFYALSFDPKAVEAGNVGPVPSLTPFNSQEMIIMVGLPASGKSSFCQETLAKQGYSIVSRDILGTPAKCFKQTEDLLRDGKSVVIDNTNINPDSRERYLAIAEKLKVPVRAFVMSTTFAHARHNEVSWDLLMAISDTSFIGSIDAGGDILRQTVQPDLGFALVVLLLKFRQLVGSSHEKINDMIFNMMRSKYREPTVVEGFQEIVKIPFITNPPKEFKHLYFQYLLEK